LNSEKQLYRSLKEIFPLSKISMLRIFPRKEIDKCISSVTLSNFVGLRFGEQPRKIKTTPLTAREFFLLAIRGRLSVSDKGASQRRKISSAAHFRID